MINAPNAILNDESGCTNFCGEVFSIFWFKFWPRHYWGYLYPTVICWQLPSKRQFKVGGWGGSRLSFSVHDRAWWCKGSEAVLAVFLALVHLFLLRPPIECLLGQVIQQALFSNSVRVLTAMPHRRTDLPLILASDTDLPSQLKPWLKLFPKSKTFFRNQLQKLILQALTMVLCILLSAMGRCRNHRCGGHKPGLWWQLK